MAQTCQKHGKAAGILILVVCLVAVAFIAYKVFIHRRQLNPDTLAAAETAMWKAYYAENKKGLVLQLIKMERNQFGLSYSEATEVAKDLAKAALKFKSASQNFETNVLPDLRSAYARIKKNTGSAFDPDAVARAELAWWVDRRTPGLSDEQVGAEIANLYALLYGESKPAFQKAGLLRAQAAQLRDQGGIYADWKKVEELLRESYSSLAQGL